MKLRTEINIEPFKERIDYQSDIFTIGSCFAQRIGAMMERVKLRTTTNPTGTLFNPMSICSTIERLCENKFINSDELHKGDSGWYHFDFHSSLSAPTKEQTLHNINSAIEQGHKAITQSNWVVITLGTSWIYSIADSNQLVANCHKQPARNFNRTKLTVNQIIQRLEEIIEQYLSDKNIIITVSPIRHIADGLIENSLSKATLRVAIDTLVQRVKNVLYFPSYEILIDDLRDYRFYADDMVHPSDIAVEYIWNLFCEAVLSDNAKSLLPQIMKIVKASEHRPINPMSEAHKSHCRTQLRAINKLTQIEFNKESDYFSEQLKINL